jgi:hypothetical protein
MKANPDKFQAIAIGKKTKNENISFNLNGNIIKCEDEVKLLLWPSYDKVLSSA